MKIAVATMDGTHLSQHFGQTSAFVVFSVEDSQIQGKEFRPLRGTVHDVMHCEPSASAPARGIDAILGDCDVVVVGGIGAGAIRRLEENGLRAVMLQGANTVDDSIARYLKGDCSAAVSTCACHH